MPSSNLRIGLCGFGNMGKTHAFAVRSLPFYFPSLPYAAEIAAVTTASYEKCRSYAADYGLGEALPTFADLLARKDIDIIDICSPNTAHAAQILAAIDAGKHVLCEKPICVLPEEEQTLAEAARRARERGLICGTVFNNRFMAPILRAKELLSEDRLGRILSFRIQYEHNSSTFPDRAPGWKQRGDCGGGVLQDLGSHILDLIRYLCGDFASISGFSQIAFPQHGSDFYTDADEAFYMTAQLKNGACGTLVANKLCTGANDDLSLAVFGEKGSLHYALSEPEWLYFYDTSRPEGTFGGERGYTRIECCGRYPTPGGSFPSPKATVGWLRSHIGSMESYLSAVHAGVPFAPSLEDGLYVQRVMQAALASDCQGGIRVSVQSDE